MTTWSDASGTAKKTVTQLWLIHEVHTTETPSCEGGTQPGALMRPVVCSAAPSETEHRLPWTETKGELDQWACFLIWSVIAGAGAST